jgi:hypothetical protein
MPVRYSRNKVLFKGINRRNHDKGKRCESDDLCGLRASHRRSLPNIALIVMVCAKEVVFLPALTQNTSPLTTEGGNPRFCNATSPPTGSITGTVVDQDGAVIPNAKKKMTPQVRNQTSSPLGAG